MKKILCKMGHIPTASAFYSKTKKSQIIRNTFKDYATIFKNKFTVKKNVQYMGLIMWLE